MYSKVDCPWCDKARGLLNLKGYDIVETKVENVLELNSYMPDNVPPVETVPQIFLDGDYVGGYEALYDFFLDNTPKKRTVFNVNNTGHTTGEYPLFYGEELGFVDTINRPYPILDTLYQKQMAQIWNEFEVDLTQDRQDMINADKATVGLMVKTILWQHLADSVASRSITGVLMDAVTNSDLEGWYNAVALFETIHARTYSHIIRQTFVDPNNALKEGYADLEVVTRSDALRDAFDDLLDTPHDAPEDEKREKLYLALCALYMLEAVNFMASFAITFGIAETGIFQGIAQLVVLICRDEMLHARGGSEILLIERSRHPEIFRKLQPKIQQLFNDIIETEIQWTDYLFSEGRQVVGLNPQLIKEYVKYMAQPVAVTLNLQTEYVESNPLPYMDNYIDSSKTQVAAQELQLTSYLVNAIQADPNTDVLLEELREKYR